MLALLGKMVFLFSKVKVFLLRHYEKTLFKKIGKDVYWGKLCNFTHRTIEIGDDVFIGANACFQSVHGEIIIGDHVMFGPNVHIHGGNHNYNKLGIYMKDNHHKELGSDGQVVIEDDCWIGAGACILKGVTIGKGSIIGAYSVITKDVKPYSIIVGNLPRKNLSRFTEEQIVEHELLLAENYNNV